MTLTSLFQDKVERKGICLLCGSEADTDATLYGQEVCKRCARDFASRRSLAYLIDYILILGSISLAMIALATDQAKAINWSSRFLFSLLSLSVFGTALVYWLWCVVLRNVELNRANAFSFLIPIFGLAMGVGFYGERLERMAISGVALALVGIILVNRQGAVTADA